jgi:N-acetylmuramoyl-L-alanine amidase
LSRGDRCARLTVVRSYRTFRLATRLLLLGLAGLPFLRAPLAQDVQPLRYTLKTIENEAGVRVILEFTRKPVYEARADSKRVYIALREGAVEPPFKKRDYESDVLEKVKFIEGVRTAEIVFYTGDDFGSFSTFEMGEPFRIVLDLRRRQGPPLAIIVPAPGSAPGSQPPPGVVRRGTAGTVPPAPARAAPPAQEPPEQEPFESGVGEAPRRAAFVVVLDPGHGGEDRGAVGPSGLAEKDLTLDLTRRLKARIVAEMEAEVIQTRDADRAVPLDERTAIANHNRADLFVSIHANASRRDNARGAETYFLSYQATDDESRAVAAIENNTLGLEEGVQGNSSLEMVLWDLAQSAFLKESSALAEIIQANLNDALDITNRGIKQAPFRVLMGATMPAVLIEVAFISNAEEERRLRDPAFKERLAAAIYDSISRFHDKYVRSKAR